MVGLSVADPDPGSGIWSFFDPWIRDKIILNFVKFVARKKGMN
jgi:hypothetical protein